MCPIVEDASTVSVVFSEAMAEETAAQIRIEGASCDAGEPNQWVVTFICEPIALDATLTVHIDPAIRAASGATLMHPDESAGARIIALESVRSCSDFWGYWPTPY